MSDIRFVNYLGRLLGGPVITHSTVTGTTSDDVLYGTSDADTLISNGGADTISGGAGDDTYIISDTGAQIVELAGGGVDTVKTIANYVLPDNVENLFVTGFTGRNGTTAVGNGLGNVIIGDLNPQFIEGAGGNDVLTGGGGFDTFIFGAGSGHDVITDFQAGAGGDLISLKDYAFSSFDAIKSSLTQVGADVVFKLDDNDSILLRNTKVADFTADNFTTALPNLDGAKTSFDDEFNGTSLNHYNASTGTGLWSTEFGFGGWGTKASHTISGYTGEKEIFVDSSYAGSGSTALGLNPFSFSDGALNLSAGIVPISQRTSLWGFNYYSGLLTTSQSFAQTYGYFEIRSQLPATEGAWPAFWLYPVDTHNRPQEIDVYEARGGEPGVLHESVHDSQYGPSNSNGGTTYLPGATTGFHTYGVLWDPDHLTYYVDGRAVYQTATPSDMHNDMYMIVNMAVGAWGGDPDPNSFSATMKVDYVRAYTLAQFQAAEGGSAGGVTTQTQHQVTGDQTITGGAGDDVLSGGSGDDLIDGAGGTNTVVFTGARAEYLVTPDGSGGFIVADNGASGDGTDHLLHVTKLQFADGTVDAASTASGAALTGTSTAETLIGAGGADTLDGSAGADTMIGGAGDDTYVVGAAGDTVVESVGGGHDVVNASASWVATANSEIEQIVAAAGTAAINLSGNAFSMELDGNAGTNTLDDAGAADTLAGGAGDDVYVVRNAGTVVAEGSGAGYDTVRTGLNTYTLGDNVEALTFTGTGNFTGAGNALDNLITGGAGADSLDGGAGGDRLVGGQGDDLYFVDNSGDVVVENAGEGRDTVVTTLSTYVTPANVEIVRYAGTDDFTGYGGDGGVTMTGGVGDDTLYGGAGNDTLKGGAGADQMIGGKGDDIYNVDNVGDVVTENAGEGRDTVVTTLSTYTAPANVEVIRYVGADNFTGYASDTGVAMTSGAGDDALYGGAGADTLNGGAGADRMQGGQGADVYWVDNVGDVVVENPGEGRDTVLTTLSTYTAPANVEVVRYIGTGSFVGHAGDGGVVMNGGAGDDVLYGGAGNDTLKGGGGSDQMIGGKGDDVYCVDNAGDVVVENAGEGRDTVVTTLDTYVAPANVEVIRYVGADDFTGYGSNSVIMMSGGAGDDTLYGGANGGRLSGGAGNDTLVGGAGKDVLIGGAGDDVLDGGAGADKAVYLGARSEYVVSNDPATGGYFITDTGGANEGRDHLINIETVQFSDGVFSLASLVVAGQTITGGAGGEALTGGAGDDSLTGLGGDDSLDGGAGVDTAIYAGPRSDYLVLGDPAMAGAYYVLDTGAEGEGTDHLVRVEQLQFSDGTVAAAAAATGGLYLGTAGADTMTGGTGDDRFVALGGGDSIDGGAGNDTIVYAGARARYVVTSDGAAGYFVADSANPGAAPDHLVNVEYMQFSDQLSLTAQLAVVNLSLQGTAGNDLLQGGAGNDTLNGLAGLDTMVGGAGDDTYYVDNAGDVVSELAGGGFDTVYTSASWTASAGSAIERVIASGVAGVSLTGNALGMELDGNVAGNTLDDGGGSDLLAGGGGNDTYIVRNAGTVVQEGAGAGYDTVKTALNTYALTDNVEVLTFTGTGAFHATGNALNNLITGGDGNDSLDGGAGGDRLVGGKGDDTYYVDNLADSVVENAGEGQDTVMTSLSSYVAPANVEAVKFVGSGAFIGFANAAGVAMTGGADDDTLYGGVGNDTLIGGGGNDTLTGGGGADSFVFGPVGSGVDRIVDFHTGQDHLVLNAADFGISSLADVDLVTSAGAVVSGHATLLYDSTGKLYWEPLGDSAHQSLIATFDSHPVISLGDFILG